MKKIALFILIFSLLLTTPIYSLEAGWHYDYRGTIIDETGGLALVCNGNSIVGELYLDSDFIDIHLSGKIKDNRITLKSKKGIIIEATLNNGGMLQTLSVIPCLTSSCKINPGSIRF